MPSSSARRIAAIDASSGCGPQPNSHPPPPMAHAPNPTLVISRPVAPSGLVRSCVLYMAPPSPVTAGFITKTRLSVLLLQSRVVVLYDTDSFVSKRREPALSMLARPAL